MIVVRSIHPEEAETAYKVLSGIEGLLVLPITECEVEDDMWIAA